MSVEDEKKPRKAPAKKAPVSSKGESAAKKVKAAAPKAAAAAPKKRSAAKSGNGAATTEPVAETIRTKTPPTHQQIAERAHSYFVDRGRQHGFHEEDWLRAERELLAGL